MVATWPARGAKIPARTKDGSMSFMSDLPVVMDELLKSVRRLDASVQSSQPNTLWCLAWLGWVALILTAVMPWGDFQNHPHWMNVVWVPRVDTLHKLLDVLGNVLLYVPFGYGFVRGFQAQSARWAGVLLAAVLSIVSEGTQLYSHSRVPSLPDILCNTSGAWVGVHLASRRARRTPQGGE